MNRELIIPSCPSCGGDPKLLVRYRPTTRYRIECERCARVAESYRDLIDAMAMWRGDYDPPSYAYPQRWHIKMNGYQSGEYESDHGEWVKWSDVEPILRERDLLRREVLRLYRENRKL